MSDRDKKRAFVYGGIMVLAAVGLLVSMRLQSQKPAPSASGYYTGPRLNKAGTAYVTDDGRIVPPPPGSPPIKPRDSTGGRSPER